MKSIFAILLLLTTASASALAQAPARSHRSPEEVAKIIHDVQEQMKQKAAADFAALQAKADTGDLDAEVALGTAYRRGTYANPERNVPKAIEWYEKAASQGSIKAERILGDVYTYETEKGGWRKGLEWYTKAAEQGDPGAQVMLGDIFASGPFEQTVENNREIVNQEKSFFWYLKAAEQGSKSGQSRVGLDYKLGRGTPKDNAKAYFWLSLAEKADRAVTRKAVNFAVEDLRNLLTKDQVAAVDQQLRNWKPTKN
jgi:hypothetical protein